MGAAARVTPKVEEASRGSRPAVSSPHPDGWKGGTPLKKRLQIVGSPPFPERGDAGRLLSGLILRSWGEPLRNGLPRSTPTFSVPHRTNPPCVPWGDSLEERITPQYSLCSVPPVSILPAVSWGEPLSGLPCSIYLTQYLCCA